MEDLLREVNALLVDFPAEQARLTRALERVKASIRDAASPSATLQERALSEQALKRLAELVTPPAELFYDDPDLDEQDLPSPKARSDFLKRVPVTLELAEELFRSQANAEESSNREDLALRGALVVAFSRYVQHAGLGVPNSTAEVAPLLDALFSTPPSSRLPLARHLLTTSLPPYFKPHPKLNPSTGRVLSRPLGGDRGLNAWFDSSEQDASSWRRQVGLAAVVNRVVETLEPSEVEDLWPYLLPPLLSYLDDFESANKIRGIAILDTLLSRVDASLLRRTGVGKVFEQSLESCFSALSDPNTPKLLAAAHPVALRLAELQYPPMRASDPVSVDKARFEALCKLFASSVIYAWEFKGQHAAVETVTARAMPPLLDAMGAASIRYLQVTVPHLTELLVTTATVGAEEGDGTWTLETATMMLEASRALFSVVRNGRLRMARWEATIGVAVAKCWLGKKESRAAQTLRESSEAGRTVLDELDCALRNVLAALDGATSTPISTRLASPPEFAELLPLRTVEAAV